MLDSKDRCLAVVGVRVQRKEVNDKNKYKPMNKILGKYAPSMSNFFWVLSNSSWEKPINDRVLCHMQLSIIVRNKTVL